MSKMETRQTEGTKFSRITSVEIAGYRRIYNAIFDMRPLTVLIGANGSGKTSILEVFTILSQSASGKLDAGLSDLGGIGDILTAGRTDNLKFALQMSTTKDPLRYQLHLAASGQSYVITAESLVEGHPPTFEHGFKHVDVRGKSVVYRTPDDPTGFIRPNWDYQVFETALSQVPKMYSDPENLRAQLATSARYGALNIDPQSPVRLPQRMRPASLPGTHGEDLVSCLYYLRETDPMRFSMVEDALRAAFPTFERLGFPPVSAGIIALTWKDQQFSKPFYMHQLSEGTLRFLWLTTLLQSLDLPTLTLIDEPEVSLHPSMLAILADLLREASSRSQIIVATHSDNLVRALTPEEVLVCDTDESGETQLRWADNMDLHQWMQDYTLDELWNMNVIGGRP
jgi:predicted ATPase